jgi:predicted membrane GTPase involved in stress response
METEQALKCAAAAVRVLLELGAGNETITYGELAKKIKLMEDSEKWEVQRRGEIGLILDIVAAVARRTERSAELIQIIDTRIVRQHDGQSGDPGHEAHLVRIPPENVAALKKLTSRRSA